MLSDQPENKRIALELAYNGKPFHGWQIQPNGDSVQERLTEALSMILGETVSVVGAGRTDTGVHASHFVCHFDFAGEMPDPDHLRYRLNSFLKQSIRIDRVVFTSDEFHSRFSAVKRTYHYIISLEKNPFLTDFSWHFRYMLDVENMNRAASVLIGEKDFTSFAKLHTDVKTNICHVYQAEWVKKGDCLIFRISANRFLRNMVRSIVGTLVEFGRNDYSPDDLNFLLDQKDRSQAGQSVPPQGLFLTRIDYPDELFRVQPKSPFPMLF